MGDQAQQTSLVNLLRNAVEANSDDDGWARLANVGHIITKQRPDFDSRNYGPIPPSTPSRDLSRRRRTPHAGSAKWSQAARESSSIEHEHGHLPLLSGRWVVGLLARCRP